MSAIRVAIIGAGYMATEHAKAFASLPGVQIAGVFSRTPARAAELATKYGAKVFDSVDALYQGTRAEIVVVTVTELSMQSIANACFKHPWLCLLEKPVGIDLPEAQAILAASRRAGSRAYVALNRRAHASTRAALKELAEDSSPRLISVLDQQDMAGARAFGHPEEVVQKFMYANSIHLVDYFSVLGRGEIVGVDRVVPWQPQSPGFVVAGIRFSSGDVGVYQAVWSGPGPWVVTVTNSSARLEMRPLERLGIQRRGERRLTDVPGDPIDTDFKPGLHYQAEQTLAALRGEPASLATLADATRSMALCAAIYGHAGSDGVARQ